MSFGEQLAEALAKKANDINTFTWKYERRKKSRDSEQKEVKMVDCTIEELMKFYKHCESMLYNTDFNNPGRYTLLNIIKEQRNKCNAELFVRWMDIQKNVPRYVFLSSIRECLNKNPQVDPKTSPIEMIVGGCPIEFRDLSIDMVLDACMDTLGKFSKKHLTLTFLLNHGVWFTEEELKEMQKKGVTDRIQYSKQKLGLIPDSFDSNPIEFNLRINPKGLSLSQMYAMTSLKSKKYSELTTIQLETLRNRILYSFENEVKYHISQWEKRMHQIELVLQSKGVNMNND